MTPKVLGRDAMRSEADRRRAAGQRVVLTNGCFDLLHVGHIRYLEAARTLGDALFVAVNSDRSVREIKGEGRPVVPEAERAEVLASLKCVDAVTIFDEPDPASVVRAVRPDVLVKGGDWTTDRIIGRDIVEESGGEVRSLPLVPGRSTSDLLARARALSGGGTR